MQLNEEINDVALFWVIHVKQITETAKVLYFEKDI